MNPNPTEIFSTPEAHGFAIHMVWLRLVMERADHFIARHFRPTLQTHRDEYNALETIRMEAWNSELMAQRYPPNSEQHAKYRRKAARARATIKRIEQAFKPDVMFTGQEMRAFYGALEMLTGEPTPETMLEHPFDTAAANRWLQVLSPSQESYNARLVEAGYEPIPLQPTEVTYEAR